MVAAGRGRAQEKLLFVLVGRGVQRPVGLNKDGDLQDAERGNGYVGVDAHFLAGLQIEDEHRGKTLKGR